jgi:hypothetical protein
MEALLKRCRIHLTVALRVAGRAQRRISSSWQKCVAVEVNYLEGNVQ